MSTEIGTIVTEALEKTEAVLGNQTWINRLHNQQSGLQAVSDMRQWIYPQLFRFLSQDHLHGFAVQKDILQSCVKTVVDNCLIGKFIIDELKTYEENDFQHFFSNLKNGNKRTTPLFSSESALRCLRDHVFYLLPGNSYPNRITDQLTTEDQQYNMLAFQFESQRLFLQIHDTWVRANMAVILQHAQDYSKIVVTNAMQSLNFEAPSTSSKIVERVNAQRNSSF